MNVKNLVLGIGIFIVFMLALGYGIEAFYASPKYEDFCKNNQYKTFPSIDLKNCSYSVTLQNRENECYSNGGQPNNYTYDGNGCTQNFICDYCNKNYMDSSNEYGKRVFIIALIIGIITLFVGYGILSVEPVGSALMAAGIGAIFYGSVRNWANLSSVFRFLLLLAALCVLIWIATRLNKKSQEVKSRKKRR